MTILTTILSAMIASECMLIEQLIDEQIIVRAALAKGLDNTDLFQSRLLELVSQLAGNHPENIGAITTSLKRQAIESDTTTRAILVAAWEQSLKNSIPAQQPSRAELERYYHRTPELFKQQRKRSFEHIFFSPNLARSPTKLASIGTQLEKNERNEGNSNNPYDLGDFFLLGNQFTQHNLQQISNHFGKPFAKQVFELPIDQWSGLLTSPFGQHFVRVIEDIPAAVKPLSEVENMITSELGSEKFRNERINRLKNIYAHYEIILPAEYSALLNKPARTDQ